MSDDITIEMTDGRYINGTPYAPGSRVKVRAAEAAEIVAQGWAKFLRDSDAETARQAFIADEAAKLRALTAGQRSNPGSPWHPWR